MGGSLEESCVLNGVILNKDVLLANMPRFLININKLLILELLKILEFYYLIVVLNIKKEKAWFFLYFLNIIKF